MPYMLMFDRVRFNGPAGTETDTETETETEASQDRRSEEDGGRKEGRGHQAEGRIKEGMVGPGPSEEIHLLNDPQILR